MQVAFSKYQGAGNDFIIIDDRTLLFSVDKKVVERLCHRMYGVGGDGLVLLQESSKADFRMRIFNSDGLEAAMCGNGLRCLARYLQQKLGAVGVLNIETGSGIMKVDISPSSIATYFSAIPTEYRQYQLCNCTIYVVHTGVPHGIIFVKDASVVDVQSLGKAIRQNAHFAPCGINVSFLEGMGNDTFKIRTYERGVEKETLACGTAVVAAGIVLYLQKKQQGPFTFFPLSDEQMNLFVSAENHGGLQAILVGPSDEVFTGTVNLCIEEVVQQDRFV